MAISVRSLRLGSWLLASVLAGAVACGGGSGDDDDDDGGASGESGSGASGGKGASGGTGAKGGTGGDGASGGASASGGKGGAGGTGGTGGTSAGKTGAGGKGATGGTGGSGAEAGSTDGGDAGADPGGTGPLGTAKDELGWDLNVSGEPLTADLSVDESRAISQEITLDGGTLTATAEDGTVFELTIPEGALYGPTVITLTPLSSFAAAPLAGETVGVQIEPDGLPLMGSPTLQITPPDGTDWAVDSELPLAIDGANGTVSLALLDPKSEPLKLALTHFSSYVVLFSEKGADAELSQADMRKNFGGEEEARIQSAAAERLGKERVKELLGVAEGDLATAGLLDLFAEYEELVLKPRLAKASQSCAAAKLAIRTLLGVERQKQLLGFEDSGNQFIDLIPTVAEVCMREEYEICRDEHVITRVLPLLYAYLRQSQLLGLGTEVEGTILPPTWLLQAEQYATKCLQFELQFDSNVTYSNDGSEVTMNETVTARVPYGLTATLTVLPEDALPVGVAPIGALINGPGQPLESTAYGAHTTRECRTIDGELPEDGELIVGFMGFTPGANAPNTPGGSAQIVDIGLSVALNPNLSAYDYTQQQVEETGCSSVTSTGHEVLSWSSTLGSYFMALHTTSDNGAWVDDWLPVNSDIVATKDLTLSNADGSSTSNGAVHLIVFHTPK